MQRTAASRKRDRMQARRSWNQFKWYRSTPPLFFPLLLLHLLFFMFHSFSRLFFSFFLFRSYWPSASVSQVRQRKWHCSADLLLLSTSEGVFLLHQLYFKEPSGCSLSSLRLTLDFFIPPNARNRRAREEKIYLKLWVQTQE